MQIAVDRAALAEAVDEVTETSPQPLPDLTDEEILKLINPDGDYGHPPQTREFGLGAIAQAQEADSSDESVIEGQLIDGEANADEPIEGDIVDDDDDLVEGDVIDGDVVDEEFDEEFEDEPTEQLSTAVPARFDDDDDDDDGADATASYAVYSSEAPAAVDLGPIPESINPVNAVPVVTGQLVDAPAGQDDEGEPEEFVTAAVLALTEDERTESGLIDVPEDKNERIDILQGRLVDKAVSKDAPPTNNTPAAKAPAADVIRGELIADDDNTAEHSVLSSLGGGALEAQLEGLASRRKTRKSATGEPVSAETRGESDAKQKKKPSPKAEPKPVPEPIDEELPAAVVGNLVDDIDKSDQNGAEPAENPRRKKADVLRLDRADIVSRGNGIDDKRPQNGDPVMPGFDPTIRPRTTLDSPVQSLRLEYGRAESVEAVDVQQIDGLIDSRLFGAMTAGKKIPVKKMAGLERTAVGSPHRQMRRDPDSEKHPCNSCGTEHLGASCPACGARRQTD